MILLITALDVLPLRIKAQNAALIFRRTTDGATVECFELSPLRIDVLRAQGSLRRNFPAQAIKLPCSVFGSWHFLDAFCSLLSRLHGEEVEEMMPKTTKANTKVIEPRDTTSPALITEMVMAMLAALGTPSKVMQAQKKYRDDVLLCKAYNPWRRSSLWLLLKIAVQSTLVNMISDEEGKIEFKRFIVFFLCCLLETALTANSTNETLFHVQAKLARRIHKLSSHVPNLLIETASQVMAMSRSVIDQRWAATLREDGNRPTVLEISTIESDTVLTLPRSRGNLAELLLDQTKETQNQMGFVPNHHTDFAIGALGLPEIADTIWDEDDTVDTLVALECWVAEQLPAWTEETLRSPSDKAGEELLKLFLKYKDMAMYAYRQAPEQRSAMVLCLATIWHAMDRITCCIIPLVQSYSPEIPMDFFSPLLLPTFEQMEQLQSIEEHISERYSKVSPTAPSVFSDPRKEHTDYISTAYFNCSTAHQSLKTRIEKDAARLTTEKEAEWQRKSEKYENLISQSNSLQCDTYEDEDGDTRHENNSCKKCKLVRQAKALTLDIYEWPLPENEAQAKAAIFELMTPPSFIAWRTMTWVIIAEIGKESWDSGANIHTSVQSYAGFSGYCASQKSRLSLGSATKAFVKAHYRTIKFPTAKQNAFCNNGLTFRYFDFDAKNWVQDAPTMSSVAKFCAIQLPTGHYSPLQFTVNSTKHCDDQVLASQSLCAQELTLHEYIAFGCLRADGEHTQWLNVSRELGSVNLDFNAEEVCLLITSATLQVGSQLVGETSAQSDLTHQILRTTHHHLNRRKFCVEIMHKISAIVDSIEANWQKEYTLQTLIICLQRILSCSKDTSVSMRALSLLDRARAISIRWLLQLKENLGNSGDDHRLFRIRAVLIKTALLCRWTYDMANDRLNFLMQHGRNLEYWIIASMVLRENLPGSKEFLSNSIQILLIRDRKLGRRAMSYVASRCLTTHGASSLEKAIRVSWDAFPGCSRPWSSRAAPNARWLQNTTISTSSAESHSLDYNVLDGQFLVGGHPVDRLPKDYMESDNYLRLLEHRILPVLPSDIPGMIYMSTCSVHGFVVYFGKRKDEILIRLKRDAEMFELLPRNFFAEDLPTRLTTQFLHILNLSKAEVEFWPIENRWSFHGDMWRLALGSSILVNSAKTLIDIKSKTFASALTILDCLDDAGNIEVTISKTQRLEISLPRLDLHFFLNPHHQLECEELRKIIDPDQNLGTFVGLRNRLILCGIPECARQVDRVLVIPHGAIQYVQHNSHTAVTVEMTGRNTHYLTYQVDSILGRLRGEGSFQSNLFKAHLHAVTSSILIDPFTFRTGTDQALEILREQLILTSGPLKAEDNVILSTLSRLTPCRVYYPPGRKVMQTVTWDPNLSSNAQHDEFSVLVEEIRGVAANFSIFYNDTGGSDEKASPKTCAELSDSHLLNRARSRNSAFRKPDCGGNLMRVEYDSPYCEDRGLQAHANEASRAYHIVSCVKKWSPEMSNSIHLFNDLTDLGVVAGLRKRFDTRKPISGLLKLKQSQEWGALWNLCRQVSRLKDEYDLALACGVIAYGGSVSLQALQTLLSFAFSQPLRDLPDRPQEPFYDLKSGTSPKPDTLRGDFALHTKPFTQRPDLTKQAQNALRAEHENAVAKEVSKAVTHYINQWPCSDPNPPKKLRFKLVSIHKCHKIVVENFRDWTRNEHLLNYICRAQTILDDLRSSHTDYPYDGVVWQNLVSIPRAFQAHSIPSRESLRQSIPDKSMFKCMSDLQTLLAEVTTAEKSKSDVTSEHASASILPNHQALQIVVEEIRTRNSVANDDPVQSSYLSDLQDSISALKEADSSLLSSPEQEMPDFRVPYRDCLSASTQLLGSLKVALQLEPGNVISGFLKMAGLWPNLAVDDMLKYLARPAQLSKEWKCLLIDFANVIAMIQKLRRLLLAATSGDGSSLTSELQNVGPNRDCIDRYPSWSLIEIDGDFMIRPIQQQVALAMISPSSMDNSLLQLNMGEGKSSVIIPLVVSALANGEQLCRLIILKPLFKQMQAVLAQCVGGLVGRRTYVMPFSRNSQISTETLTQTQVLQHQCLTEGGILMVQPEHLLSFKLLGVERMIAEDSGLAKPLIDTQVWLQYHSRDVLDESDEILDVRFQLVYTLGFQRSMDGQPDRWLLVQSVLDSVSSHAMKIQQTDPRGIEVVRRMAGAFPLIYIRSVEAQDKLLGSVLEDVLRSKLPKLNLEQYSSDLKDSTASFLSQRDLTSDHYDRLVKVEGSDGTLMKKLLLLRGLFAYGILIHILKEKRWSVDYGLDPSRCLMAVPYRAKGVPATSAEFAHPDVQLLLTCLSYYYTGVTYEQLYLCLNIVAKADEPSREYEDWTADCGESLPRRLRSFDAVNLEDESQLKGLVWPALRYSKRVADYYLSNVVFPKEGKEFDQKLSSSGWDIPLQPSHISRLDEGDPIAKAGALLEGTTLSESPTTKQGNPSFALSTGFSGTNDNRFLLPTSIKQRDLPQLAHTSAKVLRDILQPENLRYHCVQNDTGGQVDTRRLIEQMIGVDAAIRVLIDVGAQVIDVENAALVHIWLGKVAEVDAGIYFDAEDNIRVMTRDGRSEPLYTSSFQSRMDRCLVYLDEVHTRVGGNPGEPHQPASSIS